MSHRLTYNKTSGILADSELQSRSAALRISLDVIPKFAALEVDAPLTEWAWKMVVSTPAASSSDFSHRAIVLDVTHL